jgi:hypothetical protein
MLDQMTFDLIPTATSSPESESGPTRFSLRGGTMTVRCGLVANHASLTARQAKCLGLLTSGTYVQHGTILSSTESQEAYLSLVSRFRTVAETYGSTLYKMTWQEFTTKSGRLIYRLRASVRRTSDSDGFGWL